jgi:hypothetical protein
VAYDGKTKCHSMPHVSADVSAIAVAIDWNFNV